MVHEGSHQGATPKVDVDVCFVMHLHIIALIYATLVRALINIFSKVVLTYTFQTSLVGIETDLSSLAMCQKTLGVRSLLREALQCPRKASVIPVSTLI